MHKDNNRKPETFIWRMFWWIFMGRILWRVKERRGHMPRILKRHIRQYPWQSTALAVTHDDWKAMIIARTVQIQTSLLDWSTWKEKKHTCRAVSDHLLNAGEDPNDDPPSNTKWLRPWEEGPLHSSHQQASKTQGVKVIWSNRLETRSSSIQIRSSNQLHKRSSSVRIRSSNQLPARSSSVQIRPSNQLPARSTSVQMRSTHQLHTRSSSIQIRSTHRNHKRLVSVQMKSTHQRTNQLLPKCPKSCLSSSMLHLSYAHMTKQLHCPDSHLPWWFYFFAAPVLQHSMQHTP